MVVCDLKCDDVDGFNTMCGVLTGLPDFTIHHMNAQRICRRDKFDNFGDYLSSLKVIPTIVTVAETWFLARETGESSSSRNPIRLFDLPGYQSVFCSRGKRSAGVAVYVKDGLNFRLKGSSNGKVSYVHLEICPQACPHFFVSLFYMPKYSDYNLLFETMESLLSVPDTRRHVIVGDFNIDLLTNSSVTSRYRNLLDSFGFQIANSCVTRQASSTLIDHVSVNFPLGESDVCVTFGNGISDHSSIVVFLGSLLQHELPVHLDSVQPCRRVTDYRQLCENLSGVFADCRFLDDLDAVESLDCVIGAIKGAMSLCTRVLSTRARHAKRGSCFVDDEVVTLCNAKREVLRRLRRVERVAGTDRQGSLTRSSALRARIRIIDLRIRTVQRTLRDSFFRARFSDCRDSRSTWREINSVLGRVRKSNSITKVMRADGSLALSKDAVADCFNEYFSTVGAKLADQVDPSEFQMSRRLVQSSIFCYPVTEAEVLRMIEGLDAGKSTGYDDISNRLLKHCSIPLSRALTVCLNKSLTT